MRRRVSPCVCAHVRSRDRRTPSRCPAEDLRKSAGDRQAVQDAGDRQSPEGPRRDNRHGLMGSTMVRHFAHPPWTRRRPRTRPGCDARGAPGAGGRLSGSSCAGESCRMIWVAGEFLEVGSVALDQVAGPCRTRRSEFRQRSSRRLRGSNWPPRTRAGGTGPSPGGLPRPPAGTR